MIPRVRGMFWLALQIILLVTWFVLLLAGERFIPTSDLHRFLLDGAGVAVALAGMVITGLGLYHLGHNLTPAPEPKATASLISEGIFRKVRHPIYGGIILMVTGLTILLPTILGAVFLPVVFLFFYLKAEYEEQKLRERFSDYAAYESRTKRFIPWLW